MNDKGEQFMGFARAVVEEITGRDEYDEIDMEEIIARRAHDLACHVASFITEREVLMMRNGLHSPSQAIQGIPDLPELQEENNHAR